MAGERSSVDSLVELIRTLATSSVADALVVAEREIALAREPEYLYALAELRARSGRAHDALDLIDEAKRAYEREHRVLDAERCDIGRVAVLDDLGRHDEAILVATRQIDRLATEAGVESRELEVRARSNRGLCWETIGQYADALSDYDAAVRLLDEIGPPLVRAQLAINRANVLDLLGRSEAALAELLLASGVLEREGDREDRVKVAANIGAVLCRRGEYDDGLAWFRRAEALVESGTDDERAIAVETAEALLMLGAVEESAERFETTLASLSAAPLSWLEGRAWLGLGRCRARAGDRIPARHALRTAIDAFDASDNLPSQIVALLELAALEHDDEPSASFATDQARRALALADSDRWPMQACAALLHLAELSSDAAAERHLREARRIALRLRLTPVTMRVEQRLGRHLLACGRPIDAAQHVDEAVRLAAMLRGRLHHRTLLRSFPAETASCYDDLVALRLAQGRTADARDAADLARSRSLVELANSGDQIARTRSPAERELHAVYDRLLGIAPGDDRSARRELESRARELESELDHRAFALDEPVDRAGTGIGVAAGPRRARPPDIELTYHVHRGRLGVFVRSGDNDPTWHETSADLPALEAELAGLRAEGRRAMALRSSGLAVQGTVARAFEVRLERLGDALLAPVRDHLGSGPGPINVVVSPVGALHSVPFHALRVRGHALIDDAIVTVTPSLALRATRVQPPASPDRTVLVGLSTGGVPGAEREVLAISAARPGPVVLTGRMATVEAVAAAARTSSVLHLASHGMFRPDAPLHSGIRLADGWLTARAAATIDLRGATVILSACDTGRATTRPGEEILGLQYGFFAAGASTVIMSLWPAHDAATVTLMGMVHRHLAVGERPAAALRNAQLALRAIEPHGWFWSPFVATGLG